MKLIAISLLASAALLTACGGNGNDNNGAVTPPGGGSTGGGSTGGGNTGGGTATQLSMYEALPLSSTASASDFLAQINAEGSRGFRFFSGLAFASAGGGAEEVAAYVKDANTTWTFEREAVTTTSSALLSQLQASGARGFRFAGPYFASGATFDLYRKDNGAATTYIYNVLPVAASSTDFLAQANAQGANGYYATGAAYMVGASTVTIYEKASAGNARYAYEVLANSTTDADLLAQLNAEGARGYRFRTSFVFSDGTKNVYEKDTSQASSFVFSNRASQTNSTAYIQQANAQGATGEALVGDYVLPSGTISTLYVKPANCSGVLCVTRSPFGF
ncbi:MAG: hypothetical protein ABI143_10690 [Caldimonas sp.]